MYIKDCLDLGCNLKCGIGDKENRHIGRFRDVIIITVFCFGTTAVAPEVIVDQMCHFVNIQEALARAQPGGEKR